MSTTAHGDVLRAMEAEADTLEEANRYEPQTARTVRRVVDETPFQYGRFAYQTAPTLVLQLAYAYGQRFEALCIFGNVAGCENASAYKQRGLVYGISYRGVHADCTRKQALQVLETGQLPKGFRMPEPRPLADTAEDPFEGLVDQPYIGALLGEAKRERRVYGRSGH